MNDQTGHAADPDCRPEPLLKFQQFAAQAKIIDPFLIQTADVYTGMDQTYQKVARSYGFVCRGCDDNCCHTRFSHHTLVEYLYLMTGVRALAADVQQACRERAYHLPSPSPTPTGKSTAHYLCPLNHHERCLLYAQRPMICRLHGLPHEVHHPHRPVRYGPGCDQFYRDCPRADYRPFDRTPIYRRMAQLEQQLRRALDFGGRIKMTIGEMLLTDEQGRG